MPPKEKNSAEKIEEKKKIKFKENKILYIKNSIKKVLKFIWNNEKKAFIGREILSWVLGGFAWAMIAIFMAINQSNIIKPKYYGFDSPISDSGILIPGMGIRPHIGTERAKIEFSLNDYQTYVENLDLFLKEYQINEKHTMDCDYGINSDILTEVSCKYDIFRFLNELNCSKDVNYGFSSGEPCVFVKLNNLFNWNPGSVKLPSPEWLNRKECNSTATFNEMKKINSTVFVTCTGESDSDTNNIRSIKFNSLIGVNDCYGGIPFYYYPFSNGPHYMQPLIVLKLNLTQNQEVKIKCSAWSSNTQIDLRKGYGSVKFSVQMN